MTVRPLLSKMVWRGILIYGIFLAVFVTLLFCEFAIYPLVLNQCLWPKVSGEDESTKGVKFEDDDEHLKVMVFADTHLLGPFNGHWFDKLRREWQMYRAFQTAVQHFQPDVIFCLGDLFDEGVQVNNKDFEKYVARFRSLFYVPEGTDLYVVAGNHDVGFYYAMTSEKVRRFQHAFNTSTVRLLRLKQVNFVLLNSITMGLDRVNCTLCNESRKNLEILSDMLKMQKYLSNEGSTSLSNPLEYSSPIVIQHFPMFRSSNIMCFGEDSGPEDEKNIKLRPSIDCLKQEPTKLILDRLEPRLVLSAHTHHGCLNIHDHKRSKIPEYSVPSFSWRNRNNPSFYLGVFTKDKYALSKCFMPKESTVIMIYGIVVIMGLLTLCLHLCSLRYCLMKVVFLTMQLVNCIKARFCQRIRRVGLVASV